MTLDTPNRRDELGAFLTQRGMLEMVAELGCAFGGFTRTVLNQWPKGKFYYMVDPWSCQDPNVYKERQEQSSLYDAWFEEAKELARTDQRVRVLRLLSEKAAAYFDDGTLDCVYIDGNHDYEHVTQDIELWYPKLKPAGLIGGHDYQNWTNDGWFCEVQRAVEDWAKRTGCAYTVTDCSSWWHRKPDIARYVPTPDEEERMIE